MDRLPEPLMAMLWVGNVLLTAWGIVLFIELTKLKLRALRLGQPIPADLDIAFIVLALILIVKLHSYLPV